MTRLYGRAALIVNNKPIILRGAASAAISGFKPFFTGCFGTLLRATQVPPRRT
jgi:hypothetical protein